MRSLSFILVALIVLGMPLQLWAQETDKANQEIQRLRQTVERQKPGTVCRVTLKTGAKVQGNLTAHQEDHFVLTANDNSQVISYATVKELKMGLSFHQRLRRDVRVAVGTAAFVALLPLAIPATVYIFGACVLENASSPPSGSSTSGKKNVDPGQEKELFAAAEQGKTEVVQKLLASGTNANAKDSDGRTALLRASSHSHVSTIKTLIGYGADVNACNTSGITPLKEAALYGRTETVNVLLAAGAAVNFQDQNGYTALIWAPISRNPHTVKALLIAGADPNLKTKSGSTALMNAVFYDDTPEIAELLLAGGADANAQDEDGATALMFAADKSHADLVETLLAGNAVVSLKDKLGNTAMTYAEEHQATKIIELLKQAAPKK